MTRRRQGRPAVLYAAKSTRDAKGAIGTQLAQGRALAESQDFVVVAEYFEERRSAYSSSRGRELAKAKEHAERLAKDGRQPALFVQHSDRLARGDGITASHLVEIVLWARQTGVEIRSVVDQITFEGGLAFAAMMGDRNHEDSARKGGLIKDGIARERAKGIPSGSLRYGWRVVGNGKPPIHHPIEALIVVRIKDEFLAGNAMTAIARRLYEEGIATKTGRGYWRQAGVGSVLRCPLHAGLMLFDGELIEAQVEPIYPADEYFKVLALLAGRPSRGRGRTPAGPYLFRGGHLRCECGSGMTPDTKRSGSGRPYAYYTCSRVTQLGRGACPMPRLRREDVDASVFNYFARVSLDLDATRSAIAAVQDRHLHEVRALLSEAEREVQSAEERLARVRRDYTDGELTVHEWRDLSGELSAERDAACAQADQLRASEDSIAERSAALAAEDTLARQLAEIRRAIAGDIQAAEGVDAVRATLTRLFEAFVVHSGRPERSNVELIGRPWIEPIVRRDIADEHDAAQPRAPLQLGLIENNTREVSDVDFAFAPIPVLVGDRP